MRKLLIVAVALAISSLANAYVLDDGSSENSVGLTAGGQLAWMNVFAPVAGQDFINGIQLCWGTPSFPGASGMSNGTPFNIYIWSSTTGDPSTSANLIYTGAGAVAGGSIDTDVFQNVAVPLVHITTPFFIIGAAVNQNAGTYPASLDQNGALQHKSWVAGSGTQGGFNPNNLGGGIGLYNLDAIGLSGNWLLRATGVPEPASLVLLGLAGLLIRRR